MKNLTHCSSFDLAGRVEVLQARYYGRAFSPHWHEEYCVGLITAGVEQFEYRGATHRAGPGEIILLDAGQIHTGESGDEEGFAFSMLYIPESTFRQAVAESSNGCGSLSFPKTVIADAQLRRDLLEFHTALDNNHSALETESLFLEAVARVVERAGCWKNDLPSVSAPSAVRKAREYLHDHVCDNISLDRLATVSNLSKYHLLRQFRLGFGLPPHSYQLQLRVLRAKTLLTRSTPADVAVVCGFTDQSHFHRVFRAFAGTTPGCYAEQFSSKARSSRRPQDAVCAQQTQ